MKNPFTDRNTMLAFSTLQAYYYELQLLSDELEPKGGIQGLIDNATGYTKEVYETTLTNAVTVFRGIREQKKILEMDISKETEMIKTLCKLSSK